MNALFHQLPHRTPLLASIMLAGLLSACGQKGPLYLPQDPAASSIEQPSSEASIESENKQAQDKKTESSNSPE